MEQTQSNASNNWQNSLIFKMALITVMVLLLLIPLSMIKRVIKEREANEQQVDLQLRQQWGGPQTITGPTLSIPVYYFYIDKDDKKVISKKWLHLMPEQLDVTATIDPEMRYRGIYKKVVYQSTVNLSGSFKAIDKLEGNIEKIDWKHAVVTIGISDNRGIAGEVPIIWNDHTYEPQGGMTTNDLCSSGISVTIPLDPQQQKHSFRIPLKLRGSKGLYINPIGKKTNVKMASNWKDPSFTGSFLPTQRTITEEGFTANWSITHLNRNFPQQWIGKQHQVDEHQIGTDLFVPVNHYQKSLRSAKYGLLIITLTVLAFVFLELARKKNIHLLQYILVGLALVLFFSILTALSEHIGFSWAYLVASIAIIAMITTYTLAFLKEGKLSMLILGLLSIIYGFLFILLSLNDYAFLAGNIGLFIVLGIIMRVSSKVKLGQ